MRAALGLSADSPTPVTADRLAAAEQRLQRRLETELSAVRALLDRQAAGEEAAALLARLAALETQLPSAERRRQEERRAAAARLGSLETEMARLRSDLAGLHGSLAAARVGLERAGSCCNQTGRDWSGLIGAELGRLETQLDDRMQLFTTSLRKGASVTGLLGGRGRCARHGSAERHVLRI